MANQSVSDSCPSTHLEGSPSESTESPPTNTHVIDIDFKSEAIPCVYRVPKSLSETKPEAYTPQKLGLGPYHHLRRDLYAMHTRKLADVIRFVYDDNKGPEEIEKVKQQLEQWEYFIRTSYDEHLDLDRSTLAQLVAIDAIYLLNYLAHSPDVKIDPAAAADIWMLENQIGGKFLLKIWKILKGDGHSDEPCEKLLSFCQQNSPLKFGEKAVKTWMEQGHALSVMYNLILSKSEVVTNQDGDKGRELDDGVKREALIAAAVGAPGADVIVEIFSPKKSSDSSKYQLDLCSFSSAIGLVATGLQTIQKVPWESILAQMTKVGLNPDQKASSVRVQKIDLPSVSNLTDYAHIKFKVTENGIEDIKFDKGLKTLYLPAITINYNSEVILRNLMAYEAATTKAGFTLEFAEYVDLMCALVDTTDDVTTLSKEGIIASNVKPAEIVRIFNGIPRSTGGEDVHGEELTNVGKAIKQVNEVYGCAAKVKLSRLTLKALKFLAVLSTAIGLIYLLKEVLCQFFDCSGLLSSVNTKYNPLQSL